MPGVIIQGNLKDERKVFARGCTMANLDAMCEAACHAAPWRQEIWRNLRHELEETLQARWRREDQQEVSHE